MQTHARDWKVAVQTLAPKNRVFRPPWCSYNHIGASEWKSFQQGGTLLWFRSPVGDGRTPIFFVPVVYPEAVVIPTITSYLCTRTVSDTRHPPPPPTFPLVLFRVWTRELSVLWLTQTTPTPRPCDA